MGSSKIPRFVVYTFLAASLLGVGLVVSCGGGGPSATVSTNGTVNTTITDPPWCGTQFDAVWVTITKVTANISADAGPNDSSWQTLVDLTGAPKQVNLLSLQSPACLLTTLGSTTLPAGTYQQIRIYLLSNHPAGTVVTPLQNNCSSVGGWNCVVPTGQSAQVLNLSSEAQTGIKIPSSQITSGGLTVTAGQAVDLNISFGTCESLVREGNGQWRLKPVLHAGEVGTTNSAISGTVVDASTTQPISGAVVSLEVPDPSNSTVDIIDQGTNTDSNGNFSFCPLEGGPYDVVVTAMRGGLTPVTYNATVTLNVPVGSALGEILMFAESPTAPSQPAILQGQVTSTVGTTPGTATSADITIAALQAAGTSKAVTILPFSGSTTFATAAAPTVNNTVTPLPTTCPSGTDCENYVIAVPASNPSVATFAAGTVTSYPIPGANPALYWIRAVATLPGSSTTPAAPDCSPSFFPATFTAGTTSPGNQIGVDPPVALDSTAVMNFDFVSCTSGF
jgi:Domain of unknown function (DUF4382)/Carboxypeptidase regulatory-like domain